MMYVKSYSMKKVILLACLLVACLLVAWNWGPTTNANISAQNTKTPSHVRYCVYMSSGYISYHTLTPAWADLYIGELENRPQKDMHITIRYIYIYIQEGARLASPAPLVVVACSCQCAPLFLRVNHCYVVWSGIPFRCTSALPINFCSTGVTSAPSAANAEYGATPAL